MSEQKHSPLPWRVGKADGQELSIDAPTGDPTLGYAKWDGLAAVYGCDADPESGRLVMRANAEFIVRACNSHDELLAALKGLHDDIAEYARINNLGGFDNHWMKAARAAIAKAEGHS